jgi:hypothetical protein
MAYANYILLDNFTVSLLFSEIGFTFTDIVPWRDYYLYYYS